jgi:hypothetical protein
MPQANKNSSVIAVCIQEPFEDGSSMDLGAIRGDDLRFLHQGFITDTINQALRVEGADVRLYYVDDPDRLKFVRIVLDYIKKKAEGDDAVILEERFSEIMVPNERWGLRIEHVFKECFEAGYDNVLAIGSRTPTITPEMMGRALRMLKQSDAVFGPTPDGRYYIIGMSGAPQIDLSEFDWKSPSIYSEVTDAFAAKGLAWAEQEIWYAVEAPDDIEIMVRDINQFRFDADDLTSRETEIVMERLLSKLGLGK